MRCVDSRRLTGPNLLWDKPGAVLDVNFDDGEDEAGVAAWRTQVERMLHRVGWSDQQTCVRWFKNGASLAISAPMDALYAATDINDWAFDAACRVLAGEIEPALQVDAARLTETIEDERSPQLLALISAAADHKVPILVDTEAVSVGYGRHSRAWSLDELPAIDQLPWSELDKIPLALVTGTNGKTTSVRLAASIASAAGYTPGLSSTDCITAGDVILDTGDYSGPGGARTVLRDRNVDLALLETARGGLLRRGLAVARADAVLITNVAADHLGEFGVHNVDELADVKWTATRALDPNATLVLNADDARLVERAQASNFNVTWFSPGGKQSWLLDHVDRGGTLCTLVDDGVALVDKECTRKLLPVAEVPITLDGAAIHNIYNVLGVTALMFALGLSTQSIEDGLRGMRPNDNPGRSNVYQINGARFIVDFAHNPHGMRAFMQTVRAIPAERRELLIGQAGDRSDDDIRGLVDAACAVTWDRVVIKEMDHYARGRRDGEVADILYDSFIDQGLNGRQIDREQHEMEAVRHLVSAAQPGDLVILLIHEQRGKVLDYLDGLGDIS